MNSRTSGKKSTSARRAKRKKKSVNPVLHPIQAWSTRWNKAGVAARTGMVAGTIVAILCVIAVLFTTIRYVDWSVRVSEARSVQSELAAQYDFNPGNIISDGQFFNSNAMSESEVQAFLDEQGAACTSQQCLRTMTFDTETQAADDLCSEYTGASAQTAAQIINGAAKACGISQKVLLTMLQKEQHLVTATSPSDFQFKSAMGLSCPDDASCDPNYAGFFKQVYGAAKRYRYYLAHESNYGYHAGDLNFVQYNPDSSCGGSTVFIENDATALLYIYTPYQPNTAALRAGVGEGDSCSSYGNRNFSIIYDGWFGNPRE
ncbi:hemagglutinin [Bifidobacterium tsurumiense]|uniref:hemagglutinin n=1 Tax=Bifidobacterium tsurumiense TaxID=356829 RepID=UPI00389AAB72